jgi:hypothetical protein
MRASRNTWRDISIVLASSWSAARSIGLSGETGCVWGFAATAGPQGGSLDLGSRGARRLAAASAVLAAGTWTLVGVFTPALAATSSGKAPNLRAGSAYLVAPTNLIAGHYYESIPGSADFGLTIDGALALAATKDDDSALRRIVAFIDGNGKDPSGRTVNDWTGIGTSYASGGAIGKEALLAEVVGDKPRNFGGHDLIAALDASVCTRASAGSNSNCPAAGSYLNDTSVFDQTLGVIAQLRAGQIREAAAPIAYLESLQNADGSFPSLIPPSGGPDVDSTAMAVMALALARGPRAAGDVQAGLTWIASQQEHNGGFRSAGAESINSTGLAIQAMTLRAARYKTRISAARAFLAREQNSNGGFDSDAGQHNSNVRASTQAVGGAVGTSFGTLRRNLSRPAATTSHRGDPARQQTGSGGLSTDAGQHPTPSASAQAIGASSTESAGASSAEAAGTSTGKLRRHASRPVAENRYHADRANDAWLAWATLPAIAAIAGVVMGCLLSWRRSRRPIVEPRPLVESLQSSAPDRVRS